MGRYGFGQNGGCGLLFMCSRWGRAVSFRLPRSETLGSGPSTLTAVVTEDEVRVQKGRALVSNWSAAPCLRYNCNHEYPATQGSNNASVAPRPYVPETAFGSPGGEQPSPIAMDGDDVVEGTNRGLGLGTLSLPFFFFFFWGEERGGGKSIFMVVCFFFPAPQ